MVLHSKALARCAAVVATATLLTGGFVLPAGATTPSLPPSTPAVQQTPTPASPSPVAPEVSTPAPSAPQPTGSASQVPTPARTETPTPTAQPVTPATGAAQNTGPTSAATSPATGAKAEGAPYAPIGAIGAKWQQLGGSTGALGDPTSNESCDQSGHCVETFAGGEIHYTPTTGANAVIFTSGKTGSEWNKRGGLIALGYPVTDEKCDTAGCLQRFSQGIDLTWSTAGGYQQVSTHGAIGDAVYRLYGGYAGTGYPTSAEICTLKNQGCFQDFGPLKIMWSAASGAFGVWAPGAIGGLYNGSSAEQGWLGFPLSRETCGLKAGGCYQLYQGGTIMWSPAVGAHTVHGDIRRDWADHGYENGVLGYPVSDEICESTKSGCRQEYQGGTSYWSPSTGARTVIGGIRSRYVEQGGAGGYLGYPLDNEVCGQPGGGCYQWFQGGLIFWSPATGAQPVRGGIKAKYEAMSWHWGSLGYPASPEVCSAGNACRHSVVAIFGGPHHRLPITGVLSVPSSTRAALNTQARTLGTYCSHLRPITASPTPPWSTANGRPGRTSSTGAPTEGWGPAGSSRRESPPAPPGTTSLRPGPTRSPRRSAWATPARPCRTVCSTPTRAGAATPGPTRITSTSSLHPGWVGTKTCGTSPRDAAHDWPMTGRGHQLQPPAGFTDRPGCRLRHLPARAQGGNGGLHFP